MPKVWRTLPQDECENCQVQSEPNRNSGDQNLHLFRPPDEGETPHDSRLTNRHKVLWAKCGSQMRAVFG